MPRPVSRTTACARDLVPAAQRRRLFPLLVAALALAGCAAGGTPPSAAAPDMHTSRNALDWAGTYEGVLRGSEGPGTRARLVLQRDGSFEWSTRPADAPGVAQVRNGRVLWNDAGNAITLPLSGERSPQFRVGEGRLLLLDADGGIPPWNAPGRTLARTAAGR